jgi:uncharacterized protein YbbC (DUF1343 family)
MLEAMKTIIARNHDLFSRCKVLLLILMMSFLSGLYSYGQQRVRTGAEMLIEEHLNELSGKRVGLVMNPTARVNGVHMLDTLLALNVDISALFAPEHGFRGDRGAGEVIENGKDQATGLPVYSLYGKTKKPTPEMLEKIDLLLFDMQDVGARFYTYNVTLGRVIEAASAEDVPVWVLDRPNPAGGDYVAGWSLDPEVTSFVGAWPIPIAHGLTLGELGAMMIGEHWIDADPEHFRVIKMQGWKRTMRWPDTGLPWIPPSPNLPTFTHALVYLGTCLVEGTEFSEGRGTPDPFLTIGAPNMQLSTSSRKSLEAMSGITIIDTTFTPQDIPGKAWNPKFEGERCNGIRLIVKDESIASLDPVAFGARLVARLLKENPEYHTLSFLRKLSGKPNIDALMQESTDAMVRSWHTEVEKFKRDRKSYLLYK